MKLRHICKLIVAAILIGQISRAAAEDSWTSIGAIKNSNIRFDVRNGSFEVTNTKGGTPIAVVIGRVTNAKTLNISIYKWYVPLQACVDKLGIVVSLNISGKYQFENEFIFGGGNIAAEIGETICSIVAIHSNNTSNKDL